MTMPEGVFSAIDGSAFVQFYEGGEVYSLGNCLVVDSLPDPRADSDPIQCFDDYREYTTVGETVTPPGKPTLTLTTYIEAAANYLERIKEEGCHFTLFVTQTKCTPKSVFSNRERAYVYRHARITDHTINNPVHRDTDTPSEAAFNLTAWPRRIDTRDLTCARIATTETAALNDITGCFNRCAGECGPRIEPCQNLNAAADTVAAAIPDVLLSNDRGATWTSPASGFAAATDIMSGACIQIDADTTRRVFVRGTLAATFLQVEYTDDYGATWTQTDVGATAAEAALTGGSLFALDAEHLWICTGGGRVYFSDDGGATWTEQTTALAASGANALNAVHFANANVGVAVGAADTVIVTLDGGVNWTAGTATGSGDGLNTVYVFNDQRVIVGTDSAVSASPLYMTYDWTANWTTITEGLGIAITDTVEDIDFLPDDLTGFLIKNTAGPVGTVYRSIDGGWSWKAVTTPTNSGINSVYACHPNLAFCVGEANAATSFIAQVSA